MHFKSFQNLVNLKQLWLGHSFNLIQLPDFSKASNLEEVILCGCGSLRKVPPSIVSSHKLVEISLSHCSRLSSFQYNIHLQSLKDLSFEGCTSLSEFSLTAYESPSSLTQLDADTLILPAPLEELVFDFCSNLSMLPDNIGKLSSLTRLSLEHSNVRSLPESIKHLSQLKFLSLKSSKRLQSLPELPSSIEKLFVDHCTSLETVFASNPNAELIKKEEPGDETFDFGNCIKLEEPAINTILENAGVKIQRAAQTCLATMEENGDGRAFNRHYWVRFCLPVRRVPDWFIYRATQPWMTIELLQRASNRFLGFIFCVSLDLYIKIDNHQLVSCCDYHVQASDGQSVKYQSFGFGDDCGSNKEYVNNNVYLWYDGQCCVDIMRWIQESKANGEGKIHNLNASIEFSCFHGRKEFTEGIKQCGVHPIYESDILNLGKQWQMESGLGITSKRRPEITEVGVTEYRHGRE